VATGSRSHAAIGVEEQVVGLSTSSSESPGLREDVESPLRRKKRLSIRVGERGSGRRARGRGPR
jgi:hypothetical protein